MGSVTIQNLVKQYDETQVLHSIDLSVEDGKFVVLLGPSGCGKSTLLRMIAGLESVTSGDISIGEQLVNDTHPKDRNIAMVFQNYAPQLLRMKGGKAGQRGKKTSMFVMELLKRCRLYLLRL